MADWCNLPIDLLAEIALKLDSIEDFICFSAVCHSWNHAHYSIVERRLWNTKMPWLLLAENPDPSQNPNCLRKVFNPSTKRCYQMKLPQTFGARCWGVVEHGWVATLGLDKKINLFNPISKVEINLPPLETMPQYVAYEDELEWYRSKFVSRFFVLKMPPNCCVEFLVIAIHGEFLSLCFTAPNDQSWTLIPEGQRRFADVLWHNGRLFILDKSGTLAYGHIAVSQNSKSVTLVDYVPPISKLVSARALHFGFNKYYLGDLDGNLLMIMRYKEDVWDDENDPEEYVLDVVYRTTGFEVYKLDSKDRVWKQIQNLGDVALFVGVNPVIPVKVTMGGTNIKCNCIYFTDDEDEVGWSKVIGFGGHDMGIFDMETKTISPFYEDQGNNDTRSEYCPPLWLVPQF